MQRRQYLAALGVLSGTTAGCVGLPSPREQPEATAEPPTPPPEREPTLAEDHPVSITVEPKTPSGPTATIQFHVENGGERSFQMQEHGWRLFKYVDGAWRYLAPKAVPAVWAVVRAPPGGRYTFERPLDNSGLTYDIFVEGDVDRPRGHRMGPGRYRFTVAGRFVEEGSTIGPRDDNPPKTTVGADFDVDAEPLPLPLTEGMTVSERSDGVATVVPREGPADPADDEVATLVATRTDRERLPPTPTATPEQRGTTKTTHLFVEELLGPTSGSEQSIRNALAAFESGTDEVRLHTSNHAVPPFFGADTSELYAYFDGTIYHLTRANWSWEDI